MTLGPEVFLEPATAQILALALHELATNAAKYGALSSSFGRVSLSWELGPSCLLLRWVESGGPPVRPPSSEGYGTRVIGASVERQLDGRAAFDWSPDGLRFSMSIPLGEKGKQGESVPAERRSTADRNGRNGRNGNAAPMATAPPSVWSCRAIGFCWSRTRRSPA